MYSIKWGVPYLIEYTIHRKRESLTQCNILSGWRDTEIITAFYEMKERTDMLKVRSYYCLTNTCPSPSPFQFVKTLLGVNQRPKGKCLTRQPEFENLMRFSLEWDSVRFHVYVPSLCLPCHDSVQRLQRYETVNISANLPPVCEKILGRESAIKREMFDETTRVRKSHENVPWMGRSYEILYFYYW